MGREQGGEQVALIAFHVADEAARRFEALRRRILQLRSRQRRQRPLCLQRQRNRQIRSPHLLPTPRQPRQARPVTVLSSDGEKVVTVDQSKPASGKQGAHSLGVFSFTAGEEAAVIFRTAGAGRNVHLDAVQVVPGK